MATLTEPKAEKKALVHYMVESGVAIIELDDPPANTYTYEMMHQLDEAILRARFDDAAHVIVLRGHGEKFFSAGANITYLNSITPRYKYFFCLHANETLNRRHAASGPHRGQGARDRDDGEGRDLLVRQGEGAGSRQRDLPRRRLLGADHVVREAVHASPQGVEGGRPDQ